MNNTPRKNLLPFISLFAFIGAAVSAWQTQLFYATRSGMGGLHSFCNIGQTFDCTAIEMSKYAEIFGGYPLSAFAIAGYLIILMLSLYGLSENMRQNVRKLLIVFTGIALAFSVAYLIIMTTMIGKLCLLCLGVDVINLVLFLLALKLPQSDGRGPGVELPRLVGTCFTALFIAFLLSLGLNPQTEVKQEDLNDMVESVLNAKPIPLAIPADAPYVGDANAPITIVKFSDYQCPACRMGANAIHPLMKRYPKQVKFVFMNYPLDMACNSQIKQKMHEFACESAAVAVCAADQGKFIEAYETLFENQENFANGQIADLLSKVKGLDLAKLKSCMTLPSTGEKIKRDVEFGTSVKIQSTPTFFINGKKVEGGLPTNVWIKIIDKML